MKLVADESVDQPIVDRLRREGHDVVSVNEIGPGIPDDDVLETAREQNAVLLTADKDFGELVYRQGQATEGVILVRLAGLSAQRKEDVVSRFISDHGSELHGAFTVVSPGLVRIRPRMT